MWHWVISIHMTHSYPVISAPKCHQMLRNYQLGDIQIKEPVSSGEEFLVMPFWLKSRLLIAHWEISHWHLRLVVKVVEGRKVRAEKKTHAYSRLVVLNMTHSAYCIYCSWRLVILFYRMISWLTQSTLNHTVTCSCHCFWEGKHCNT